MKKILVVDDDHSIREILREMLELEGYVVETAANGREAIEKLQADSDICLVTLDLMMPEMTGREFLEHRKKNPRLSVIPVIVCSAEIGPAVSGNYHFLEKPIDFERFMNLVRRHC